jgi:hypothetical protein
LYCERRHYAPNPRVNTPAWYRLHGNGLPSSHATEA